MELKTMNARKLVASILAAVLALSILSLSVPALSQTDDEGEQEEQEQEEQEQEEQEQEEQEQEEQEQEEQEQEEQEQEEQDNSGKALGKNAEKGRKSGKENAESKRNAAKEKAQQAKETAKAKGKPEVVEDIDNAERYFGKLSKVVVVMKISLEPTDEADTKSFGSAHLFIKKFGEEVPKFRAVINILLDKEVEELTACLNDKALGENNWRIGGAEGMSVGHFRESLELESITIPGTAVEIFEGTACSGSPILSGNI
jgi:uncharacterized membrane protein YqiK